MRRHAPRAAGLLAMCLAMAAPPVAAQSPDSARPACPTDAATVGLLRLDLGDLDDSEVEIVGGFVEACRLPEDGSAAAPSPETSDRCRPHLDALVALYAELGLQGDRVSRALFGCTIAYAGTVSDHDGSLIRLQLFGEGDPQSRPVREMQESRQRAAEENRRLHDLLAAALAADR